MVAAWTCWNRFSDWQAAGVWDQIHQILLNHLRSADRIDFERFPVDTSHVRPVGGGEETGPSPGDSLEIGQQTRDSHRRSRRAPGHRYHPGEHSGRQSGRPVGGAVPPIAGKPGHPPETPGPCDGGPGLLMTKRSGRSCGTAGSTRSWPSGGRPTATAWVCIAGWWSERSSWFHQFRRLRVRLRSPRRYPSRAL